MNEREQDNEDKTEEASEERRKQYREEGQIANPREVVHALALLTFVLALSATQANLTGNFSSVFQRAWVDLRPFEATGIEFSRRIQNSVAPLLPMIGITSVIIVVAPVLTGLILTRFAWTWKKISFDLAKLNPIQGTMRIFSLGMLPELIKSLVKMVILGSVTFVMIRDVIRDSAKLVDSDLLVVVQTLGTVLYRLLIAMAIASLVIGLGDWAWNWWKLEKEMRMTKQEIKEEIKSQEGDPHVKGQRRRMARDLVMRSIQQVPKATFVITNPEHFAVAIRYSQGMNAPIVVAKGMDFLAQRIKEIAKKNDIVIVENKPLARTLYKTVKIGQEVPSSLYASIVEVMKYIYYTRGKDYFNKFGVMDDTNRRAGA